MTMDDVNLRSFEIVVDQRVNVNYTRCREIVTVLVVNSRDLNGPSGCVPSPVPLEKKKKKIYN